MNSTSTPITRITTYYIVCSLSGAFALTAVTISITILILVWRTKPILHTVRHLLTCNTCIASIIYCIIQATNYAFLIFHPEDTSDMSCRWRGYFAYISLCGVAYSFLIQSISRLFISIFSTKYRWLVTFKVHRILIYLQWFVSLIVPLPAILTDDIYFRPNTLCWVPLKRKLHIAYTCIVYYGIPILLIIIIYIFIYYRVQQTANRAGGLVRSVSKDRRNLKLLRNIVILLTIYLIGGIPTTLFFITSIQILYLTGIVTISLTIAVEKVCTILLDQELRQAIRKLISKPVRIAPIYMARTMPKPHGKLAQIQPDIVQTVSNEQRK